MKNKELLDLNVGKKISYRKNGSRRVISGILIREEGKYSTKLGVLYIEFNPEDVAILSSEVTV